MATDAEAAGWNPEDGDPPYEHGTPVEPLDSDTDLEALSERVKAKIEEKKANKMTPYDDTEEAPDA